MATVHEVLPKTVQAFLHTCNVQGGVCECVRVAGGAGR